MPQEAQTNKEASKTTFFKVPKWQPWVFFVCAILSFNLLGLFSLIFTIVGVIALIRVQNEDKNRKGLQLFGLVAQWALGAFVVLGQIGSLLGQI